MMMTQSFFGNSNLYGLDTTGVLCKVSDMMEHFFIAHPESGKREGTEHERIMFFSPTSERIDKQTDITGFAEAVVNFTENFTQPQLEDTREFEHRFVTTSNLAEVYIRLEDRKFMMGMSLNRKSCQELDYTVHLPTLKTILVTAYKTFKLFFGSFSRLLEANPKVFKSRLNYFFSRYLSLLKVNQMPLVDYFVGVDFLQLEPVDFLRVETLTAQVQEQFPQIEKVMFLYQNRLMWYSVSKVDVIVLFRYLTQNFLPTSLRAELKPDSHLNRRPSGTSGQHEGKFLCGPSDLTKSSSTDESPKDMKCPVVYLSTDEESRHLSSSDLIVYRALNATMCMFVKKSINHEILHDLDAFLGPELSKLASRIGDVYGNSNSGIKAEADYFHFIYYNPVSLSVKTSFGLSTDGNSNNTQSLIVPKTVYRMACEVCENFITDSDEFGQVQCKGDDDWWIVGKKSNGRILILFLPPRPPTTVNDVDSYVNQIIKTHFDSIFVI